MHHVNHAAHLLRLLTGNALLACLTPGGAEHIARPGLVARPLDDPENHLETHVTVLANNNSPLVAEYYKGFLKRVEEEQAPVQMMLPMLMPVQNLPEHQLSVRWTA